ncbi:hypothetical protein BGW36DRAFT_284949 [Talaromyces proteolyticus]|uniref:DUF3176 domain containing protein n=1 Tax=Talaromyces proteolyticus TaxID=1131652 RepID=A0AAD4L1L6_9EURO|nr:uncharacterized protein BGW36DRAFT_284949 [Talaromyces proteolyticus]KAH8705887.1 hypothetical protein BGW36DRAFT_284949 [Talaromyces proteolyticus]
MNYEPLRRPPLPPSRSSNNDLLPPSYSHSRNSSRARSDVSSDNTDVGPPSWRGKTSSNTHVRDKEKIKSIRSTKKNSTVHGISHFFLEVLPRGWTIEILSCAMSVAALISIVIVLNQYNQQSMPSWPLGITLNTLLAFLTAVSQAGFLNPVFQGLSQMKWNWFVNKDRPLSDFGKFDNASRGSWGSFLLVFTTKGRLSILMATVILVSSIVTSTITQAALTQGTRYIPTGGTAELYLQHGLLSPLNTSGTMLWSDLYASDHTDGWERLTSFSNSSRPYTAFSATQLIYLNESDVASNDFQEPSIGKLFMPYTRAMEALFYMCIETYNISVVNGTTSTTLVSTTSNVTDLIVYGYLADGSKPVINYNRTFTVGGQNYTYANIGNSMAEVFQSMMFGAYYYHQNEGGLFDMSPFSYAMGQVLYENHKLNVTTGTERDPLMRQNIEFVLENMAKGVTNWLRSLYPSPVQGRNYAPDTYVIVRWPFIACLAVQVTFSIIFLVWIILDTKIRKVKILKESAIAALFALTSEDRITLENRISVADDEKNANDDVGNTSKAALIKGGSGQWNLKLAN